jgi:hypothetical protein
MVCSTNVSVANIMADRPRAIVDPPEARLWGDADDPGASAAS